MEQVIQNKIFNAKSEIAEVRARESKWMGDGVFNGLRDRVHFGLMIAATIITFIVSLFVVDGIGSVFLNAGIAFLVSFVVVGAALIGVDDSFHAASARYNLIEARKALIEDTLGGRVHEGYVFSSGTWTELTIERDNVFEKVMVRIVEHGETEAVEMKAFVNA